MSIAPPDNFSMPCQIDTPKERTSRSIVYSPIPGAQPSHYPVQYDAKSWEAEEFGTVHHEAHADAALAILEQQAFRPGLVYDKSCLVKERIHITWASPNKWERGEGTRYGSVRFLFPWKKILESCRYWYWIEAINYTPIACRFLITSTDHGTLFQRYDPATGGGPWQYDAAHDRHIFNGSYAVEFMIEHPLSIATSTSIELVKHHPRQCRISPDDCQENATGEQHVFAQVLGNLVARGTLEPLPQFLKDDARLIDGASWRLFNSLKRTLKRHSDTTRGRIEGKTLDGRALGRAVLGACVRNNETEFRSLISHFVSHREVIVACAECIRSDLGLEKELDLPDIETSPSIVETR